MSTRLRMAMEINGHHSYGPAVLSFLTSLSLTESVPMRLGRLPLAERVRWYFDHIAGTGLRKKLWIFREPRRIKAKDSRYKQLLADWGVLPQMTQTQGLRERARVILPNLPRRTTPRRGPPTPPPQPQNRPNWWDTVVWTSVPASIDFFGGVQ